MNRKSIKTIKVSIQIDDPKKHV